MTERGGPTTQAGIRYQNSIAALYLGDLLQLHASSAHEQVSEVRIEAPSDVDDVVVRFADHHRDWVQVKLELRATGEPWQKLWGDFHAQLHSIDFGPEDHLVLVIGDYTELASNLRDCAERTQSSLDRNEWHRRLTINQKGLVQSIANLISQGDIDPVFTLFQKSGWRSSEIAI